MFKLSWCVFTHHWHDEYWYIHVLKQCGAAAHSQVVENSKEKQDRH